MPSSRVPLFVTASLLGASFCPPSGGAQEVSPSADLSLPRKAFAAVLNSNDLVEEGSTPFHLQMSFQVTSLDGKSMEPGTLDYWWSGTEGTHLDVSSASIGTVHGLHPAEVVAPSGRRALILAGMLLDAVRHPGSSLHQAKGDLTTEDMIDIAREKG